MNEPPASVSKSEKTSPKNSMLTLTVLVLVVAASCLAVGLVAGPLAFPRTQTFTTTLSMTRTETTVSFVQLSFTVTSLTTTTVTASYYGGYPYLPYPQDATLTVNYYSNAIGPSVILCAAETAVWPSSAVPRTYQRQMDYNSAGYYSATLMLPSGLTYEVWIYPTTWRAVLRLDGLRVMNAP